MTKKKTKDLKVRLTTATAALVLLQVMAQLMEILVRTFVHH